jgi:hypothetical protein
MWTEGGKMIKDGRKYFQEKILKSRNYRKRNRQETERRDKRKRETYGRKVK